MEVFIGKIVGRISEKRWAQVYDFAHETRGRLIVAASLVEREGKTEMEMVEMGRELLARIHELYFGSPEEEAMKNLKLAMETVEAEFGGAEMAALAVVGEALYVMVNAGGAWAEVGGKEGWVINPNLKSQISNLKFQVLSSWAKDQETIIMGNNRFWEELSLGIVKAAVGNNDMEAAVETLGAVVHGGEKGEGAAGVIVKMSKVQSSMLNKASEPELPKKTKKPFKLPEIKLPKIKWPSLPNRGPVYVVRGNKELNRKRTMWAGIGFLVVLVLLVSGWMWSEKNRQIKQSAQNRQIEAITEKFNEAKAVVTLNPARSRELLKEVEPEVQKFKGTKKIDQRVSGILGEWEGIWNQAMGTKLASLELIVDLGLVREGMAGERLKTRDGKLEVLDTQGGRLIEVNPEKKSAEVIAGKGDLGAAKLLATYPGKTVVFSDKGIVQCSMSNVQCSMAAKSDDGWGEVVDMGMWGGNIYLLSKTGIWKLQGGESGYGAKQAWLAGTEDTTSLSQSQSMAIDGSVWVASVQGSMFKIQKYTRGVRENFEVSGVEGLAGDAIYTDDETEKLYVLDAAGGRVVVLAKTGEYESQYTAEAIKGATGLVVDEKAGKIYVLAGTKIYEINK